MHKDDIFLDSKHVHLYHKDTRSNLPSLRIRRSETTIEVDHSRFSPSELPGVGEIHSLMPVILCFSFRRPSTFGVPFYPAFIPVGNIFELHHPNTCSLNESRTDHGVWIGQSGCTMGECRVFRSSSGKCGGPTDGTANCANMDTIRLRWGSKNLRDECWIAKPRITCDNTNRNTTLSEAQGVSLQITCDVRVSDEIGWNKAPHINWKALVEMDNIGFNLTKSILFPSFIEDLRVEDSHTGNHHEDDFTSLETIRRFLDAIGSRSLLSSKGRESDHDESSSQQQNKSHKVIRAHTARPSNKKGYARTLPNCNRCKLHHTKPCTMKCNNCKRVGHMTRDCKTSVPATTQRAPMANQKVVVTCYKCGNQGHYRNECSKLKNQKDGDQKGKE
ncbi:reverse transcriptase domain-containing protein [Tanacetum coccineum]|uniref:Reverse transcriptase domain-containing protein n=1 Tax=Tanacetum coccineum TaxID=301880 RepID=A0ABQ5AIT3_9ASTR